MVPMPLSKPCAHCWACAPVYLRTHDHSSPSPPSVHTTLKMSWRALSATDASMGGSVCDTSKMLNQRGEPARMRSLLSHSWKSPSLDREELPLLQ